MGSYFLDVGVVRIQEYLGRWPQLAGRRGASALVAGATTGRRVDAIAEALDRGVTAFVNTEGGSGSGVVHLVVDAPDDDAVEVAARTVLASLRRALPAADLEAVWVPREPADAPYLDAVSDLERARAEGRAISDLGLGADVAFVARCELCGRSAATSRIERPGGEKPRACRDCRLRNEAHAGRHGDDTAESDLRRWADEQLPVDGGWSEARDFAALARLDQLGNANHVAHVFADGNAMGEFFRSLADRAAADPDHAEQWRNTKRDISVGLDEVTVGAVRAATLDVVELLRRDAASAQQPRPLRTLPVVPHVVAGDDVLISVPGPYGLRWAMSFLSSYEGGVTELVARHLPDWPGMVPSASAGVVVANQSFPFDRCLALAADLLATAKRGRSAGRAALQWLSITHDGEDLPAGRSPWVLADLEKMAPTLATARRLPPSARSGLRGLIDPDRPQVSWARVENTAARRSGTTADLGDLVATVAGSRLDPEERLRLLEELLDLSRWCR